MPSSIDSASSLVAGASLKVMSLSTSTKMPPRPNATNTHFLAARQHLLHLHAENLCFGIVFFGVGKDGRISLFCLLRGFHADDDPACFRLMEDLRRDNLHDHRKADAGRELRSIVRGTRDALLGYVDAVGLANAARFRRSQRFTAGSLGLIENFTNGILIV